jgi:VCBS repeat-containing protein
MSIPKTILVTSPAALDADGICLSQTKAGSGSLTLDGVLAGTTLDYSRKIAVASTANIAARVFTITGTDANNRSISDTVTGVNNNSVSTTKYFSTVTNVSVDASFSANNVTVGTTAALATKINPLNHYDEVACQVAVELLSGTATWSIEETHSDSTTAADEVWIAPTAHSGKSASLSAPLSIHAKAMRLVTSAISSPSIRIQVLQSGC